MVNATANSVSFIDTVERSVTVEITVSERPVHAALSPDGRDLYVSCSWEGVIDVIDTATDHVLDDAEAMELFKRSYRKPWEIPEEV